MTQPHEPAPSPRKPLFTWIGWMAVIGLTAFYANRQVVDTLTHPERLHANDFKHMYLGAVFVKNGQTPYDAMEFLQAADLMAQTEDPRFRSILPYVYLPFTGFTLIPLTWFRFPDAVWIWFWINQILFLLGGWLAFRAVGFPRRPEFLALLLFFLSWNHPFLRTLTAGQLNIVLFFCFALVLYLLPRAPAWATGAVAAFAALFKITPAILFFFFLAERRYRHAAWMAAFTILFVLLSLPVTGVQSYLDFLPVLRDMGYGKSTWSELGQLFYRDPWNQSLNSFYHHILAADPRGAIRPWLNLGPRTANLCTLVDSLALMAATAFLVWPRRSTAPAPETPSIPLPLPVVLRFSIFMVLSLLIPSILWDHYLVVLVLPFLALSRYFLERRSGWVGLFLFAASVVVTGGTIALGSPRLQSGLGLIGLSAKLWGCVAIWFLLGWALIYETRRVQSSPKPIHPIEGR